jgi:MoaA/NifB/PqqE/SkfB family radical SAM enzyme
MNNDQNMIKKMRLYSPSHIVNKIGQRTARWLKPEKTWALPTFAQIETVNRCNCRCVMCAIDELSARPAKFMELQEFKRIIDNLPFIRSVGLTGIGESLLNKHIFDLIDYCRSRGISTDIVSNGMLLDSKRSEALIRAGLSSLNISIDSYDPEIFSEIRVNADLKTVSENVGNFIRMRNSLGQQLPIVKIITVASKKNKDELPNILQHSYDLGVDGTVVRVFNSYHNQELEIPAGDTDYQIRTLDKAKELQNGTRSFSVQLAFSPDKGALCEWPWTMTYITVEGDVTPCCVVGDARKLSFGNINNEPFEKIWNNPPLRSFRSSIKNGVPPVCATCDLMANRKR